MKNNKVYINVKLSGSDFLFFRIGGAGLGNILFPWARGIVFARKNNYQKINSNWSTLKFGTFLRKERDKRTYHDLFKERNIANFKKIVCLLFSKKISENAVDSLQTYTNNWPVVVEFEGMRNLMDDIIDDHEIVKEELVSIVRTQHLKIAAKNTPKAIAVHIRLGDFYQPSSELEIRNGRSNCRLPLNWYVSIINKIRNQLGKDIDVAVFSDGNDEQLAEILALPNVNRISGGSAISDLLSLSKSKILIASNSTFSLWASYLGRVHTIWFPGTFKTKLFKETENVFEGEIDYNDTIPEIILNYIS